MPAAALPDANETWSRLTTARFVLVGNVSPRALARIGLRLTEFQIFLARDLPGGPDPQGMPTTVLVFADEAAFTPYNLQADAKPANRTGVFATTRDGNFIGLRADADAQPIQVVFHELVHDTLNRRFRDVPLWLNEGLAEYYSTFKFSGKQIELGLPVEHHLQLLQTRPWMSLSDVLRMDTSSKDYNEGERKGLFYAESWLLTHHLILESPDLRPKLVQFLSHTASKLPDELDFRTAFGLSYNQMEERLRAMVFSGKIAILHCKLSAAEKIEPGDAERLSRAETLYHLGEYLTQVTPWRKNDATEHFQAALEADPNHARSLARLAETLDRERQWAEAEAHFRRAVELGREDDLPFYLFGTAILERYTAASRGYPATPSALPEKVTEARGLLSRGLELNGNRAETYARLGATYLYDPADVETGIALLEEAVTRLPGRPDITLQLMALHLRRGDRATAESLADRVGAESHSLEIRAQAESLLALDDERRLEGRFQDALAKLNAGQFEEGIAELEALLRESRHPDQATRFRETLEEAKQFRVRAQSSALLERQRKEYNRAVTMANDGNTSGAITVLEKLVPKIQDPNLARAARDLLRRLRSPDATP